MSNIVALVYIDLSVKRIDATKFYQDFETFLLNGASIIGETRSRRSLRWLAMLRTMVMHQPIDVPQRLTFRAKDDGWWIWIRRCSQFWSKPWFEIPMRSRWGLDQCCSTMQFMARKTSVDGLDLENVSLSSGACRLS